jgi:8-amino-7-oxononanoate synthase
VLFDCGLFTNAVTQPAVPAGQDLIRTSFIASHTDEQIEQVLTRFADAGRRTGLLSNRPPNSASQAAGR